MRPFASSCGRLASLLHPGVIPFRSLGCHSLLSIARRSRSDFLRTCPCRYGGHEARWWDAKERFSFHVGVGSLFVAGEELVWRATVVVGDGIRAEGGIGTLGNKVGREGRRAEGVAAPMAAVAAAGGCCLHHHHHNCVIIPAPSIGSSNKAESDSSSSSSCFRQLFTLRVHPLQSIQSVRSWATRSSALFSRPNPSPNNRRYSRLTTSHHSSSGGISSVVGKGLLHPDQVFFMIHKLMCVCKGDRRRRQNHKVCNCLDKASEDNVGLQANGEQITGEQPYGIPEKRVPERWDVVGLGQAMVDFSGTVTDEFLEELGLVKGTRKVVNHEERGRVLRALDGTTYKLSAGGSLSNTLVALARLGVASSQSSVKSVAMTGSVGSDALGDFYRTKLLRANVHFLSQPVVDGTTGTVIVLTTPDAQRTMLSYQGMSSIVNFDATLAGAIAKCRLLIVEGYLWEINQTIEAIAQACEAARQQGVLVALTASDVSCVTRHRQQFWDIMCECTDVLFTNADEARALCAFGEDSTPEQAAKHLSQFCPLVSVTDGARGSYIGLKGEIVFVPPAPCVPVDTCGAGDAYAAGMLYGLLRGVPDLKGMGDLAARVAAVVVGQQGTRLKEEHAVELAESVNNISELLDTRIMELMGMKGEVESEKISSV